MNTFILIALSVAILYLIARKYFFYKADLFKKLNKIKQDDDTRKYIRSIPEGDRTIEEIMFSKPSNEVLAELSSKNLEDLTGNEILVLSELTKWYDENPSYKGS